MSEWKRKDNLWMSCNFGLKKKKEYSAPYLSPASPCALLNDCFLVLFFFKAHLSWFLLCRLTPLWPQRSATSLRCSRTATKTQLTSSLSRCRTRPPPQQPLKLDSKTIASLPIGVHLENKAGKKQALLFYYLLIIAFRQLCCNTRRCLNLN